MKRKIQKHQNRINKEGLKKIKIIFAILIFTTVLLSCSKNDDSNPDDEPYDYNANVYIAGVYDNKAVVWKNGNRTILSASTRYAQGNAVFVSGNDVYVAGIENKESGVVGEGLFNKGKIWKNGASLYTLAYVDCDVNDVAVINNDVYAVGRRTTGGFGTRVPTLWKNGTAINLQPSNGQDCNVVALEINNNKVYCAGYNDDGTRQIATLWQYNIANGAITKNEYATPNFDSHLNDVTFDSNNNPIVCGEDWDGYGDGKHKPFYKIGNNAKQLLPITSIGGYALGVHATATKTIVSGRQFHPSLALSQVCFWENGTQNFLFQSDDIDVLTKYDDFYRKSFLFQDRLFQCGQKYDSQASTTVNFIPIFLDGNQRVTVEKADRDADAFGIFVTPL